MMRAACMSLLALGFALSACTEKPQTAGTRKSDTEPWAGQASAFAAPGWKGGDRAAWEEQIRNRARGQNDYARTQPGQP